MRRLADAVGLREGEGGRTARLFALIFVLTCGFVLSKTAQQGLFLGAYSRASIADAFIISALCLAAASFVVSALAQRMGPSRLLLALLLVAAVLLIGARVVVTRMPRIGAMANYVVVEVALGLLIVQAWSVISEALDVRSAKRLLPLVGNAAGMGWALGGFAAGPLARFVGTENLLVIAAAAFVTCTLLLQLVVRCDLGGRGATGKRGMSLWDSAKGGLRYVASEPLLRSIAAITVAGLLIEQILDYQLFAAAQARLAANPDRIAAFMGTFFGITGCITLVAPLTISGRVLSRFGSAASTATAPGLVVLVSLAVLAAPSFALIVVCRGGFRVAKQALASPARAQMQTTIPAIRRAQAGALIKGVLAPLFYAGGGVALKLLPHDMDYRWLSAPAAVLGIASVVLAWWQLRPAYFAALKNSVQRQRLDLETGRSSVMDSECGRMLASEARSADPQQAAFALKTLVAKRAVSAMPSLTQACSHAAESVRVAAISGLAQHGSATDRPAVVAALAAATTSPVRVAGLSALAALGVDRESMSVVRAQTLDADPQVRALAQWCLVQGLCHGCPLLNTDHCGVHCARDQDRALVRMLDMLGSPNPQERSAVAWAMGHGALEHGGLRDAFAALLGPGEHDVDVRRAALRASGRLDGRGFMRDILLGLVDHSVAEAAYGAFADAGDDAVPDAALALSTMGGIAHCRSASALATGSGPHGDALLARMLLHDNRIVRYRAARAISARRHTEQWSRPPLDTVTRAIDVELAIGYRYYAILVGVAKTDGVEDFDVEPAYQFIADEIVIRIRQTEQRVFSLLALVIEPAVARTAELRLHRGSTRDAAAALELVEHALPASLRLRVVRFLEPRPLRMRLDAMGRTGDVDADGVTSPLDAVVAAGDVHLERCAMLCYGDRMQAEHDALYREHLPLLPVIKRFQLLRGIPLFADLSGEALMQVAKIATHVEFPDGHEIFRRGDPGDQVFMVIEGAVAVRHGDTEIARFGAAEFFGELAVLDGEPRSASAVCAGETSLLCIAGPDLDELMERRPQIARKIIAVLTRRLRKSTTRLAEL